MAVHRCIVCTDNAEQCSGCAEADRKARENTPFGEGCIAAIEGHVAVIAEAIAKAERDLKMRVSTRVSGSGYVNAPSLSDVVYPVASGISITPEEADILADALSERGQHDRADELMAMAKERR